MKKIVCLVMALALLAGCAKQKQAEQVIPQENEELTVDSSQVVPQAVPEVEPVQVAEPQNKPEPVTFNSLMKKYGVYGRLAKYDKLLSQKEKKEAKRVEDELYEICKKVKADPTVPEWLAKKFRDYIEDEEDRIEDKY